MTKNKKFAKKPPSLPSHLEPKCRVLECKQSSIYQANLMHIKQKNGYLKLSDLIQTVANGHTANTNVFEFVVGSKNGG